MTNEVHNLDQDNEEFFEFIIDGKKYRMRYPTAEEVDESKKLDTDQKQNDWLYSFIEPVDKDAPADFQAMIKKKNIKFLQRFNKMVLTELGG